MHDVVDRRKIKGLCQLIGLAALVAFIGCSDSTPRSDGFEPGRINYDTRPLDVKTFAEDSEVQRRILQMPFGEAAARLGSLKFEGRSQFLFSRGGEEYEQSDIFAATQDSSGNFHVLLDTPKSQIEVYLIDETLYIRHDKGHLRHKPRRDIDAEAWCETAFSSLSQALEPYRGRIAFSRAQAEEVDGRKALRFTLSLRDEREVSNAPQLTARELPRTVLPVLPPTRWRELGRPLDLKGVIWLDEETGVVLKASFEGRIEIADRQVRPTQLSLRYDSGITDVGDIETIAAPESRPEFERAETPGDMLGFFRDHLPREDQPTVEVQQ